MLPVILGIAGDTLSKEERRLFSAFPPLGFILFRRNVHNPDQVKRLVNELREVTGRDDVPVLLDQEGARVQKLRPPHWLDLPPMRQIGDLFKQDAERGLKALRLDAQTIAGQFNELGINTICSPVVDVPVPGAHDVIGERAFAEDADTVITMATAMANEYLRNGITPILKHIPGHGRATEDSHFAAPLVSTDLATLEDTDFRAFRETAAKVGAEKLWAMTAHVTFSALDDTIATVSKKTIDHIRNRMGITGPIIGDNIEMDALGGTLAERAMAILDAGCDALLYCKGDTIKNEEVLSSLPKLSDMSFKRFATAAASRSAASMIDWRQTFAELKKVMDVQSFAGYKAQEDITEAMAARA